MKAAVRPEQQNSCERPTRLRPQNPRSEARLFARRIDRAYFNHPASIASIKMATMLVILIIGFTAGPAVSL